MKETGKTKPQWYAIYTAPRSEKKVSERLCQQGIDHYLPIHKVLKQWSDRKKWVEEPLFRSYLFVHITSSAHYDVLNIAGVSRYITFGGRAAVIPDHQILTVKLLLQEPSMLQVTAEEMEKGTPVEIIAGPLMGTVGELVNYKGENRIAVRVDYIGQSLLLNVPAHFAQRITDTHKLAIFAT